MINPCNKDSGSVYSTIKTNWPSWAMLDNNTVLNLILRMEKNNFNFEKRAFFCVKVVDRSIHKVNDTYQDRAEIKRAVPIHLAPGENEVIVYDLAECIDKNSIRYTNSCH